MKANVRFWSRDYVKVPTLFKYAIDDTGQRCGYIEHDEAIKHGFTEKQWEGFYKRASEYMKDFIKNGYCEAFPINVVFCEEDEKYYLTDGQGRVAGMKLAKEYGRELPFNEVPVQTFIGKTLQDVHDFIREVNTKKSVRMSLSDISDIDAKVCGGEVAEVRSEVVNYRDNVVGVKNYTANLMFFGSKAKRNTDIQYDRSALRKNYKTYCDCYERFVKNVGTEAVKQGVVSEGRMMNLVRKEALAILFESYMRLIEKLCERYGFDVNTKLSEATDNIIFYWKNKKNIKDEKNEDKFIVAMNTDKGAKKEFSDRFGLYKLTMKLFKDALDTNDEDIRTAFLAWTTHAYDKYKNVG